MKKIKTYDFFYCTINPFFIMYIKNLRAVCTVLRHESDGSFREAA